MIDKHAETRFVAHASVRVRRNVFGAAVAASLMLYFGFYDLAVPRGDDLFSLGNKIWVYTLRGGGVAMCVAAVWSQVGSPGALLFDAACSVLVGVLLAIGAGIMMYGGGMGGVYLLFAGIFVWVGLRNGRDWARLRVMGRHARFEHTTAEFLPLPTNAEIESKTAAKDIGRRSGREQDNNRVRTTDHAPAEPGVAAVQRPPSPADGATAQDSPVVDESSVEARAANSDESAPEGFLASFAPNRPSEGDRG